MRVVSNTSPILNLALVDHLYLLHEQMGEVIVPPKVVEELRLVASSLKLKVTGVIGILLRAHHEGGIVALEPILADLEEIAGFYVGRELRRQIEGRR